MKKLILLIVVVQSLFTGAICIAQDQESAAARSLRVAVLKRILAYEKRLSKQNVVNLALLYDNDERAKDIRIIAEEFKDAGINVSPISTSAFKSEAKKYDAVYVSSPVDARDTHKTAVSNGVLTLTNSADAVKSGLATVCVILDDGKPVIYINKNSAQEEKREFPGEILALSTVIQ